MEIGIDSFAAVGTSEDGKTMDGAQSVAELLERVEQADRSGLDVFGIGEHHRREFLDSATAVILAAAADNQRAGDAPVPDKPDQQLRSCLTTDTPVYIWLTNKKTTVNSCPGFSN